MAVTASDLRAYADLPPVEIVPDTTLMLFINQAQMIIDEDFADVSLTQARADAITLNLAAHFSAIGLEKGGLTQQIVGKSEERYIGINNKNSGLALTRFGQQALALDTTGTLSKYATSPVKAEFEVI